MRIFKNFSFFLLLMLLSMGCQAAKKEEIVKRPVHVAPQKVHGSYVLLGYSVEKRPIYCYEIGSGDDVVLVIASIHGNEVAGTPIVRRLAIHLHRRPSLLEGRKVLILSVANPDGVALSRRFNARNVDLNRNFKTGNRINKPAFGMAPLSEPEAMIINNLILRHKPDRIVSLHEPYECIDYDGPLALELAQRMSEKCNLPVKKLGAKPGSLGSYAGLVLKIPIITLELPRGSGNRPPELLWRLYGKALIAFVLFPYSIN